jgi:hypothetical protein
MLSENDKVAIEVSRILRQQPISAEAMAEAVAKGMIAIGELEDGAHYYGTCRNAKVAVWCLAIRKFIYWRHKFGARFAESIEHPQNDNGFDLFIPIQRIEPTEDTRLTPKAIADEIMRFKQP